MSHRAQKFNSIHALAIQIVASGHTMRFIDLATWLNGQGIKTGRGGSFNGGRGVARMLSAAYAFVRDELGLGDTGAAPIALAFTNQHGLYSYE